MLNWILPILDRFFRRPPFLRRIDAVLGLVDELRSEINRRSGAWDQPQRKAIANELRSLVQFLPNGVRLDNAATTLVSQSREVINRWAENLESPDAELILTLEGIERMLRSRSRLLASDSIRPRSDVGPLTASGQATQQEERSAVVQVAPGVQPPDAQPMDDFTPKEAAILATLTEKFYGSWAFRIAGLMLVVAAVFAIAGMFVIGDKTINVRQDLEQSADRAKKEIADRQQSTVAELDQRRLDVTEKMKELEKSAGDAMKEIANLQASTTLAITTARSEFERQRADFAETINQRKAELEASVGSFEKYTHDLKQKAVGEVITVIQASLKEQESGIKAAILAPLIEIRDSDVADLHKIIQNVSGEVAQVRKAAKDQQNVLNDVSPVLERLHRLTAESDQIERTIKNIKDGEAAAREVAKEVSDHARRAAEYVRSAGESAANAEKARTSTFNTLTKVSDEAEARLRLLGKVEFQFRTLENSIASLEKDATQEKSRIDKVKQVLSDVDRLQEAMRNLRERLASLEPEVNITRTRIEKASGVLDRAEPAIVNIAKSEETIRWMGERLNTLQAAFDELKSGIAAVSTIIEPAKKLIGEIEWAEDTVNTARHRLDQLQPAIETITTRIENASRILDATPVPRRSEADLTLEEWKGMQQVLAALGHDPGLIDGRPGERTRRAIRSYQNSIGKQPSGQLTSEQISWLLKMPADRKEAAVLRP